MSSARLSLLERTRIRKEREAATTSATRTSSPPLIPPVPPQSSSPSRSSSPPLLGLDLSTPNPLFNNSGRHSMAQRKSMGDRILKKIKLENDSRAEFTQFIETTNQEERDALQVAYTLRLSDMYARSAQEAVTTWTPSRTLEKTLRPIIYSLLLMPTLKYYCGNLTNILITIVRDAGIKQLPKDDDDCDALVSWLNKETNNAKYMIKKTIADSTVSGSKIANIADLTDKLLSSHAKHFNATLSLYFRVALIRSHIGLHDSKKFWSNIDDELETQIYKGGPEAVVDNFKTLYEEDISRYGDPAQSKCSVSADLVGEKRPKWLASMQQNAPRVQRVKVRATKRRRDESEDEEDDAGRDDEGRDNEEENHQPQDEEGGD